MTHHHPSIPKFTLLISDFIAFVIAFIVGLFCLAVYGDYQTWEQMNQWWTTVGRAHGWAYLAFVLFCMFRFYSLGVYSERRPFWDELRVFLSVIFTIAALHGVVVLIAKWPFVRVVWLMGWLSAAFLVPISRHWTRRFLARLGLWKLRTVILGTQETAASAYLALMSEPSLGFEIEQFYGFTLARNARMPTDRKVEIIRPEDLISKLKAKGRIQIIIALEDSELAAQKDLIEELTLHFPELQFVPSLSGLPLFEMEPHHFFSHEILILKTRNNLHFRPRIWLKRSFDISASLTMILLLSPILVWTALRIRFSGPQVLFKHRRVGQSGQTFNCYKFRTMALNSDIILKELLASNASARKEWDEKMKITDDPRVTSIGKFLRKTSLDELPQLWNVLRGDMSLVGPRPIVDNEISRYGNRIEFYTSVKPGITGLWQVSGRSDTDYKTRVQLDTWYVKNWTLWYDIAILFKTIRVVISRSGAY